MHLHGDVASFVTGLAWGAIGGVGAAAWASFITIGRERMVPWRVADLNGRVYGLGGYNFWVFLHLVLGAMAGGVIALFPGALTDVLAGLGFATFLRKYCE